MENKNVILLKKRCKLTFTEQCATYEDYKRIDVTSANRNEKISHDLSPFYLGPVVSSDGLSAYTFEDLWQYGKVYPKIYDENGKVVSGVDANGDPTEEFFKWRARFYAMPKIKGTRHPAFPPSIRHRDCLYTVYFENGELKKLDYVESRKKIYIPEYAKLVVNTDTFKQLKKKVESGQKIALVDFDGWNYYGKDLRNGATMKESVNNPHIKLGHSYVIKMLLQGDIEVKDGVVIDNVGIFE